MGIEGIIIGKRGVCVCLGGGVSFNSRPKTSEIEGAFSELSTVHFVLQFLWISMSLFLVHKSET